MEWNLVDHLSPKRGPRAFHMPLASVAPGSRSKIDTTLQSLFAFYEYPESGERALQIQIKLPPGQTGFGQDPEAPDLPHPAIRLHAMMGPSVVTFEPAAPPHRDRLVLRSLALMIPSKPLPPWFELWKRANCIPETVIYENVDKQHLEKLLKGLPTTTEGKYGLSFPTRAGGGPIDAGAKNTFIAGFLAGKPDLFLVAGAGAFLGIAGPTELAPGDATQKEVRLHVAYQDHSSTKPHWLNPREFFYLLFGEASAEAKSHPLLAKLDQDGKKQLSSNRQLIASKSFVLRPPLRTYKRVEWEALQEISHGHAASWGQNASLSTHRFFNDYKGDAYTHLYAIPTGQQSVRFVNDYAYQGNWKCNLFVTDICLRAGFRVPVIIDRRSRRLWYYAGTGAYGRAVHHAGPAQSSGGAQLPERIPLLGVAQVQGQRRRWGWKIEGTLRRQGAGGGASSAVSWLNNAIDQESRCFLMVKYKPGNSECSIGHVAIIHHVEDLQFTNSPGLGYQSLRARLIEAWGSGIARVSNTWPRSRERRRSYWCVEEDDDGNVVSRTRQEQYIHILELEPGLDPDYFVGLRDILVQINQVT
jgi:hypothetical protein